MACKTTYDLHHNFAKIAEEAGFAFNNHRPRIHIDWNKIRLVDIDSLIRERKFVLIEHHLNDILDCRLESEFDVRILDEGVLKLFRLAQLAVEYQQFCRHYLDRSVHILRQEITTLAQELDSTKKTLDEKEEELKKLKRRTRHTYKTPLPYGNDNIANMILKTLSNRADLFPSTSNLDPHQYNKCKYCDKVFLNQLYLKSHIERRHADVLVRPQKETDTDSNNKLTTEILELRMKLKDMEQIISSSNNQSVPTGSQKNEVTIQAADIQDTKQDQIKPNTAKIFKDAEVSASDEYLINKLEEWKRDEQEKHSKEISKLRTEILETINSIKEKDDTSTNRDSEAKVMEQLRSTIKQQDVEILTLKEELTKAKIGAENEMAEKYKEAESRAAFWIQKADLQTKQYESLLEKLSEVANDAKESRAIAEAERERATKLETKLEQSLKQKVTENNFSNKHALSSPLIVNDIVKTTTKDRSPNKSLNPDTLAKLQKRAQELLYMDSMSSTSSDTSSSKKVQTNSAKNSQVPKRLEKKHIKNNGSDNDKAQVNEINLKEAQSLGNNKINELDSKKALKTNTKNKSRSRAKAETEVKTPLNGPESPIKVIRAKLTEEVNNRLVLAGVDPLKSRLPQNVFRKQRAQLQQQHELKSKINANVDKIRNAILAYLDDNTGSTKISTNHTDDYVPSTKPLKSFRGFTSVIENVKSKALSLVKGNDMSIKAKRKSLNGEVSKKAMLLLKTPPDSAPNSPQNKPSPNKMNTQKDMPKNVINKKDEINKLEKYSKENINAHEDSSSENDEKYYQASLVQIASKSMETLLKSPARIPASASLMNDNKIKKYTIEDESGTHLLRSQSATHLNQINSESRVNADLQNHDSISSNEVELEVGKPLKKANSEENVQNTKQTKGVLKNASSTSSLSKKKVLFDMDAIQMKSLSASPSQSITEKSDNDKYELGLVNLDTEEWDISSIESDHFQNDTKLRFSTRTAPKIAELKKKIESQLARRNETPTALVGSVDVLGGSLTKPASIAGSNTSLGSSILDESESAPISNHKTISKKEIVKNKSNLDILEFSVEELDNKNESF